MTHPITKASLAAFAALAIAWPAAAETTLRLAHNVDPADPRHTAAETFARVAAEESDGELDVRVFPAAQLGKSNEVQEGLQQGTVDIVLESIGTLSSFHPLAGIESMPYLFRDAEHYLDIWTGPVGEEIKQTIAEEANFKLLGHMFRGTRELTSNKRVESIEDLEGLKIRVTPVKERLVTWQTFGASPTPMPFSEVFTSLQQGVIDAQENPLPTIAKNSLNEVQDYLIRTSHMANGFTFQMNADKFEALPSELQQALEKAAAAAAQEYNAYIEANEEALLKELEAGGMTVIEIDQTPFREKAKEVVAQFPDLEPWYLRMTEAQ
ncbi:TRAP transporter substrate-binding protein [Acuticoccus sp.]|uniref:TRAP transporter substrate-binding protein n=1 Tax=Acuticoccus sp. TaxID=1904378 RepID=UPI003B5160E2